MAHCTGATKTGRQCRQKADGCEPDPDRCRLHPRAKQVPAGNVEAFNEWVSGLDTAGSENVALVQAGRGLAAAVDANDTNANLWGRYLEALQLLMADDEIDDEAAAIFDEFGGDA